MWMYGAYIGIGILSTLIANLLPRWLSFAGWTYFLLGPVSAFIGGKRGNARRALEVESAANTA